ncbi:uncharacterized protein BDR25DRAFT_33700 [Lindgomyces ingoldianus]|uniref:Uncharacterized protein n=1 Tax=Lindgomyces ingoldianus TaxID=673940 RepID=A0ACB6QW50_9PLEO|nr:uncharacterized protein BDR25DRAFT_33700 [Lindgomyces ingoldianus]KAF2470300.1 hypothetical protein BDR25DRAFT_33700 [Lindgomyces ingoldianus]
MCNPSSTPLSSSTPITIGCINFPSNPDPESDSYISKIIYFFVRSDRWHPPVPYDTRNLNLCSLAIVQGVPWMLCMFSCDTTKKSPQQEHITAFPLFNLNGQIRILRYFNGCNKTRTEGTIRGNTGSAFRFKDRSSLSLALTSLRICVSSSTMLGA